MIAKLLPDPILKIKAPTSVEVTVRKQESRTILHILSYIPERRTKTIDVVDTKIPLYNVEVKLREEILQANETASSPKVALARAGISIPSEITSDGYLTFTVPCVDGYEVIIIE